MSTRRAGWPLMLVLQAVTMALAVMGGVCFSLLLPSDVSAWVYEMCMWVLLPGWGAFLAYCAVRRGLHHYAAWEIPPVMLVGIHWLLTGAPPENAGMALLTVVLAMLAASAGEEVNRRRARSEKRGNNDGGRR